MTYHPDSLTLDALIHALDECDNVHHLSLVKSSDGKWKASVRRHVKGTYSTHIDSDPVAALRAGLGPNSQETWEDLLPSPSEEVTDEDIDAEVLEVL